jgi:hypothetical protein
VGESQREAASWHDSVSKWTTPGTTQLGLFPS